MQKSVTMTSDVIRVREPVIQCEDEFIIYDETSELVFEYLKKIDFIVTEGGIYSKCNGEIQKKRNKFR